MLFIVMKKYKTWSEIREKILSNPEVKAEYDKLEPEFQIIREILDKRIAKKMSQKELAEKINTKQSAIARLEGGGYNPSIGFLQKVAKGLDCKLEIKFVPIIS